MHMPEIQSVLNKKPYHSGRCLRDLKFIAKKGNYEFE